MNVHKRASTLQGDIYSPGLRLRPAFPRWPFRGPGFVGSEGDFNIDMVFRHIQSHHWDKP